MITAFLLSCAALIGQERIPRGSARLDVETNVGRIEVFTYKPDTFRDGPMLVVLHGTARNAREYRDDARGAGDRLGMLVVVPRFDRERFGGDRYHRGGLIRDGKVAPRSDWTWGAVPRIVDEVRRREGRRDMPYYLFGHSAGGQFLSRMAGFVATDARRVMIANPSAYLFPSREAAYPYGFGGLPEELSDDEQIRRYLALPLTIFVGTADVLKEDLDESPEAYRQGANRYERGRNVFCKAEQAARARGWDFRWTLVEAPGVGHDHRAMLDAAHFPEALLGREGDGTRARPGATGGN